MIKTTIREAENGWIVIQEIKTDEGVDTHRHVVEYDDGDNEGMAKLLKLVAELNGCKYNKYRDDNLNISFDKKGHKLE